MSDEEDQPSTPQIELKTAGFDSRFPNTNQAKNCWQNYVDHYKCVAAKGEEFPPCHQFKKTFTSLCPEKWVEKWDEQRDENVFPALREKKEEEHH